MFECKGIIDYQLALLYSFAFGKVADIAPTARQARIVEKIIML